MSAPAAVETPNERQCNVCKKPVHKDAAVCTECESWQFPPRTLVLLAKFVLVVLAPLAAWWIADRFQRDANIRSSTEASITRVTEQMADVIDLSKQFQLAFDGLPTNCGKDA